MKIIITEEQFDRFWLTRRFDRIQELVDRFLVNNHGGLSRKFMDFDVYFNNLVRLVGKELTHGEEMTYGQKVVLKDLIRTNLGFRIEYYYYHGELY